MLLTKVKLFQVCDLCNQNGNNCTFVLIHTHTNLACKTSITWFHSDFRIDFCFLQPISKESVCWNRNSLNLWLHLKIFFHNKTLQFKLNNYTFEYNLALSTKLMDYLFQFRQLLLYADTWPRPSEHKVVWFEMSIPLSYLYITVSQCLLILADTRTLICKRCLRFALRHCDQTPETKLHLLRFLVCYFSSCFPKYICTVLSTLTKSACIFLHYWCRHLHDVCKRN